MTDDQQRTIEYMPLAELLTRLHPQNPKQHDLGAIIQSYKAHGYVASGVLDDRTGLFLAGHGRVMALDAMKRNGAKPPDGIRNGGDDWLVPVQTGYHSDNDTQALAYLAADNKLTIAGGWDEVALAELLQELANSDEVILEASGFDGDELDDLLRDLGQIEDDSDNNYSRKIEAPTYEITGDKPQIQDLFDDSRTKQLVDEIDASDLPEDEKRFLKIAAQRHTVLDFGKIAEYYAHSDEQVQNLMEDNALVIIDFNKAIELGFVTLTECIAELVGQEYGE
jgi:hypothetical protein